MQDDTQCDCGDVRGEECCSLEAVVSIDERGQVVLPKELRQRMGLSGGDRLAIISYKGDDGGVCCLAVVKADSVAGAVRSVIQPILGER